MSFDRVAAIYDATRAMPEAVLERIADRIVDATGATKKSRFLELGIGTGRIALPLIRRGYRYTGVDISNEMLQRLETKVRTEGKTVELFRHELTDLPLGDASVDVVICVHVLHLVSEWRKALDEVRRVLKPGGHFVLGSERGDTDSPAWELRRQWYAFVAETGTQVRAENGSWNAVDEALTEMGCRSAVFRVARWTETFRPRDLLRQQLERTFSHSWGVPDDVLRSVHDRLLEWVQERYGDPDQELDSPEEFRLLVSRFAES
jgi:ubiquinone/menaquinone biosynthesis C-methylase UbiE